MKVKTPQQDSSQSAQHGSKGNHLCFFANIFASTCELKAMQMKHSFFRTTANGMHFRRPGGNFKVRWALMSVRLWNFKDGGSYNAGFLPKNQHAQRKLF